MKKLLYIFPFFFAHSVFASFGYYLPVTIDHTKVPSTQTNFPVDIDITNTNLKTTGNGGNVQNSNGYDIYAYSDSACTTRIPIDREKYTSTTGQYIGHAKIASLSSSVDTIIYLCNGDSGISTDPNSDGTYGSTSVWDSNFKSVWHLAETSMNAGQTGADSTSNTNVLNFNYQGSSVNTTPISAKVDGGAYFNSSSQYAGPYAKSNAVSGVGTGSVTMEGWFNLNSTTAYDGSSNSILQLSNGNGLQFFELELASNTSTFNALWAYFSGGFQYNRTATTALSTGTWYYFVITSDNSTLTFKINNSTVGTVAMGQARNSDGNLWLAYQDFFARNDNVKFDEVRVSSTIRPTDWQTTTYNNQSATSTFYTIGSETPLSTPAAFLSRFILRALMLLTGRFIIN